MASSPSTYTFSLLLILTLTFPIPIFSLITANFHPSFSLLGDARLIDNPSHVQLTRPFPNSSGQIKSTSPINFLHATSFSTEFTFSNAIALVFTRNGSNRFIAVEFDTNLNNVRINVNGFVNAEDIGLVLNSGEKFVSWVDYDAGLKRLEVRLSRFGDRRPEIPMIASSVDFLTMWGRDDVFVGISSGNGNLTQSSDVYSWRFRIKNVNVPHGMHSFPVDPHSNFYESERQNAEYRHNDNKKGYCFLGVLEKVIFATGCGTLIAFGILFVWAIFVSRDSVFPVDCLGQSGEARYRKIDVVVEKDAESGGKS